MHLAMVVPAMALVALRTPLVAWEILSLVYHGALAPNTALAELNVDLPWPRWSMSRLLASVLLVTFQAACQQNGNVGVENPNPAPLTAAAQPPVAATPTPELANLVNFARSGPNAFIALVQISNVQYVEGIYLGKVTTIQNATRMIGGGQVVTFDVLSLVSGAPPARLLELGPCGAYTDDAGVIITGDMGNCSERRADWTNVGNPGDILLVFVAGNIGPEASNPDYLAGGAEIRGLRASLDQGRCAVDASMANMQTLTWDSLLPAIKAVLASPWAPVTITNPGR
jgi:hypothetical protein